MEQMLTYAIQDEYLAQAACQAVIAAFGADRPYANIEKAEGRHIAELKALFAAYGLPVPENTAAGLVTLPATLEETYPLEAQTEIRNIAMYAAFLRQEGLPEDVRAVFASLMKASEIHLAAFERQAGAAGGAGYGSRGNGGEVRGAYAGRYGVSAQDGFCAGCAGVNPRNNACAGCGAHGPRGGRGRSGNAGRMNGCDCGACPQD